MFALIYFLLSTFLVTIFSFYINTFIYSGSIVPNTYGYLILPKLPVAIWIFFTISIFNILSTIFIFFSSFKSSMTKSRYKHDLSIFYKLAYLKIADIDVKNRKFHTNEFKHLGETLSLFNFVPKKGYYVNTFLDKKIKNIFELLSEINTGKSVDLSKYKDINPSSYIYTKNSLNRLSNSNISESKLIKNILNTASKNKEFIDDKLLHIAFTQYIENAKQYKEILKYSNFINLNFIFKILENNKIKFSVDDLKNLFKLGIPIGENDYIILANLISNRVSIDISLSLFENHLIKESSVSYSGYIFLLCKFKLIDKAKNILSMFSINEYKLFRSYILMDENERTNINIEDFLSFNRVNSIEYEKDSI